MQTLVRLRGPRVFVATSSGDTGRLCRFLHTHASKESEVATLSGGHRIGFRRYGVENGSAVFYLHGGEGSGIEGAIFAPPASKLGVSIIAPDRPGIGSSWPQPNRSILDHAKDVSDLAKVLGLRQYRLIGISAGGPYALACAHIHPAKSLRAVTIVAGVQPPSFGLGGVALSNQLTFRCFQYVPRLLRLYKKLSMASYIRMSDEELVAHWMRQLDTHRLPEEDQQIFSDPDVLRLFVASTREHFKQGFDAWMQEGRLLARDWCFRLEDISFSPIRLWYAKQDDSIASCTGPELKRILGDKAELHMEDETHLSLEFNCREKILADLIR